jgi:hypothetical protein
MPANPIVDFGGIAIQSRYAGVGENLDDFGL